MGKTFNGQGKHAMKAQGAAAGARPQYAKGGRIPPAAPKGKPGLPPKALARPAKAQAPAMAQPAVPGRDAMAEGQPFKRGGKC